MDEQLRQFPDRSSEKECFSPSDVAGWFWEICVTRVRNNLKMMPAMLKLWMPEMEGSARFLHSLSVELSPDWWKPREKGLKIKILDEIKRIDDGRGIVNDWLASIIREENDWEVLQAISPWNWPGNPYPAVLLEAWNDKINNEGGEPSARHMALQIITGAYWYPEKFSIEMSPENNGIMDWDRGGEKKQATILKYLTGIDKWTVEKLDAITSIVTKAGTMPEVYGEAVLTALLHQWDARMRKCVEAISANEGFLSLKFCMDTEKTNRKKIWRGMIGVASYCPAAIDIIQPWVEYWLPRETDLEILNLMADWQPADESAQKRLIALWKPYLFPRKEDEPSVPAACEKVQWAAWRFMWKTVSRQGKLDQEWEETGNNYLDIMHLFLATIQALADRKKYLPEILMMIAPPDGLAPQQQAAWNNLWLECLQSSNGQVVKATVIHLFRLAGEGLISSREVKGAIFKELATSTSSDTVRHLLEGMLLAGMQSSEHVDGNTLGTGWFVSRQSALWRERQDNFFDFCGEAVLKQLTESLGKIWREGREIPSLSEFYLKILQNDSDRKVITCLGKWELSCQEQKNGVDRLAGFFQKSGTIWQNRLHDPEPGIRYMVWKVLDRRGQIPGIDLMQCLSGEQDWVRLYFMSKWTPPRGETFPPGFWEGWKKCLQKSSERMNIKRPELRFIKEDGRYHSIEGDVFFIAEEIRKTFMAARFSGRMEENSRWKNDLNDIKTFWEELIAEFPESTKIHKAKGQCKVLHAMLALDSVPEVFQTQWSKLSMTERYMLWRDMDELLVSFPDFVLTEKNQEKNQKEPDRNIMCNLATVMEERMDDKNAMESETFRKTMVCLWNCELWPPEQMPPGWARFCEILEKETDPERFVRLIQMGREVKDLRCRRILQQMMESMRQSRESLRATLAEYAICCDLAVECENLGRYVPQGRTSDEVTEWRWLRQVAHRHPDLVSRAKVLLKGDERGRKMNIRQTVTLANCLAERICPKTLRDGYRKTAKSGIKEKTSSFCDRQEIGIVLPKPEQSAGDGTGGCTQGGQMAAIIRLTG